MRTHGVTVAVTAMVLASFALAGCVGGDGIVQAGGVDDAADASMDAVLGDSDAVSAGADATSATDVAAKPDVAVLDAADAADPMDAADAPDAADALGDVDAPNVPDAADVEDAADTPDAEPVPDSSAMVDVATPSDVSVTADAAKSDDLANQSDATAADAPDAELQQDAQVAETALADVPPQDAQEADVDAADSDTSDVDTADAATLQPCLGAGPNYCADGNACTTDGCDPTFGCVHLQGVQTCSDGDTCTVNDLCVLGACVAGTQQNCDDDNACTTDACVPAIGCTFAKDVTTICNDSSACTTGDHCGGGACTGTALTCDDDNVCTDDSCDANLGCLHLANAATCSDGDACTVGDLCAKASCAGAAINCNDGVFCTTDSCEPVKGCVHANNSNPCNDGSLCTQTDFCEGGKCTGSDPVLCAVPASCHLAGVCDSATGVCSNPIAVDATTCSDGTACTVGDACKSGSCVGTLSCDDGNTCTNDSCSAEGICVHTAVSSSTSCDDGNGCTAGETCAGTTCGGGTSCASSATCVGSGSGGVCTCKSGYIGNGFACATQCGDGILAGDEGCDDGNVASEDGCTYKCTIETGWNCTGTTKSTCTAGSCLQAAALLNPANAPSAGAGYPAATWSGACTTTQFGVTSNGITPYTFIAITPNALTAKTQTHNVPRYPTLNPNGVYQASMGVTGITVNGLSMYAAIEAGPQNYGDPIYNGITDGCNGHTSPQEYHFHALQMKCLVASALLTATPWLNADPTSAPSPVLGWAADGFPIYGPVACKDADCTTTETVLSGYAKTGNPATYAFLAYTWSAHAGDARYLDECNGRVEPNGAYHYHATSAFPYVPACFKGTPGFKGMYAPASAGMPGTLQ